MISLNLIPQNKIEEIKIKRIYLIIKKLIILFLLFSTIVALSLIASRYILEQKINQLITENISSLKASQDINQRISFINQRTAKIKSIQNNFIDWHPYLIELSLITPESIKFQSLSLNRINQKLTLNGLAETRQDLLELEKNIDQSKFFYNVNLPLRNLLNQRDIQFNLTADISLNYE